jgi:hypothetical protein
MNIINIFFRTGIRNQEWEIRHDGVHLMQQDQLSKTKGSYPAAGV